MTLQVLSPGEVLLHVEKVKKVIAQAENGQIGIFPGHTQLLAETVDGSLTYETLEGIETILLSGGILKVSGDAVVLFSGGFFDLQENDTVKINYDDLESEQNFSRLTADLSRRLKLS